MPNHRIPSETKAEQLRVSLEGPLKFIQQAHRGTNKQAARTRAREVIDLLRRHLDELGVDRSLTRPLADIQMAFSEAERGRVVPLFEPEPLKGRPPAELRRLFVMAKVALAIDMLMKAGRKKEEAAREVVKKLRKYGVPIKGKKDIQEWETVVRWREDLAKAGRGAGWHNLDWDLYGGLYLLEKEGRLRFIKDGSADPEWVSMPPERRLKVGRSAISSVVVGEGAGGLDVQTRRSTIIKIGFWPHRLGIKNC